MIRRGNRTSDLLLMAAGVALLIPALLLVYARIAYFTVGTSFSPLLIAIPTVLGVTALIMVLVRFRRRKGR